MAFGPKRVRAVLARVVRFAPRWRAGWDRRRGGRGRNRWRWRVQWSWRHGRHRRREWDWRLVRKWGDRPLRGRPGMLRPGGQLLQLRRAATPVVQTRRHLPRGSRLQHVLPFLHVSHDSSDQRRAAWDLRYLRKRRRLRPAASLSREPHVPRVRGENLRGSLARQGRAPVQGLSPLRSRWSLPLSPDELNPDTAGLACALSLRISQRLRRYRTKHFEVDSDDPRLIERGTKNRNTPVLNSLVARGAIGSPRFVLRVLR
jgi:hypothetical protein